MATKRPDHRSLFAGLDRDARRRIMRAVNRGQAVDDPGEAAVAARAAANQQRFWRIGWLAGPLLAILLSFGDPWNVLVVNVAVATALFAAMAYLFWRRARRAEEANRAVAARARSGKGRGGRKRRGRKR